MKKTHWIRSLPGLWFAFYLPIGITFLTYSQVPGLEIVGYVFVMVVCNLVLLYMLQRKAGRERAVSRTLFAFAPSVVLLLLTFFRRDNFAMLGAEKLDYLFNMIYAVGVFGFWLPCDEAGDENTAEIYYQEYKNYLWPSVFLTTTALVVGI